MSKWLDGLQPYGSLLMRLVLGAAMVYHGYGKVIPQGAMAHHAHFVHSLGLPAWLGYVSALTEFIGGILLILGLLTRFSAFMVMCNMLVAVVFVNVHHGYTGSEYSLALLAIAVALLFQGAGALAADAGLGWN